MRLAVILLLLVSAGCSTAWQRHGRAFQEAQADGKLDEALREQQWLIDHAFSDAPAAERGKRAEAERYLNLAALTAQAGNGNDAIEALRLALQTDPTHHEAVLRQLEQLPLPPRERRRVTAEFRWNLLALLPGVVVPDDSLLPCWPYRVRQVQVHRIEVRQGVGGGERIITYDGRSWVYDPEADSWHPDGGWVADLGAETERVLGPTRPRYRAIVAADGGFFAEGPIPPCHHSRWSGPFDAERNGLFVTPRLPEATP
ncbi:MAG: hypothetical protein HY699_05800 [Deltaproteobacteria bacterium]|nr:hypothetical protein [Deltaproteobacteria bacterium]